MSFLRFLTRKTLLSDHMPFLVSGVNYKIMSWNILCRMKFFDQWKYFNNGFACKEETLAQYQNRLNHVAAKIDLGVKEAKPSVVCLQECPETKDLRENFTNDLKRKTHLEGFVIEHFNNDDEEYYLITLYDKSKFTLQAELTQKIKSMRLEEGLSSRILPLVLLNNATKEKLLIVNVHANFGKDVKKDILLLRQAMKAHNINDMAILGDFNRDLTAHSDDRSKHDVLESLDESGRFANLYVKSVKESSFIARYNADKNETIRVIETRDGAMTTFPMSVKCLVGVNKSDLSLTLCKPLSSDLKVYPDKMDELENEEMKQANLPRSKL